MIRALLLAAAIAAALAWLGPALDAVDDHSAEFDQARELEQAQRDAAREQRLARALQAICGPQAAYQLTAEGTIVQCFSKRGRPTLRAEVPL